MACRFTLCTSVHDLNRPIAAINGPRNVPSWHSCEGKEWNVEPKPRGRTGRGSRWPGATRRGGSVLLRIGGRGERASLPHFSSLIEADGGGASAGGLSPPPLSAHPLINARRSPRMGRRREGAGRRNSGPVAKAKCRTGPLQSPVDPLMSNFDCAVPIPWKPCKELSCRSSPASQSCVLPRTQQGHLPPLTIFFQMGLTPAGTGEVKATLCCGNSRPATLSV